MIDVKATQAPASAARKTATDQTQSSANSILVVDDNSLNAELVTDILEMHGFHVESTDTAEAAIIMAQALHPALILMDFNLPGMNGIAATKILKNDPATRDIIVIGLTGENREDTPPGFDGYLMKPFQIQYFVNSVKSFLSRPAVGIPA